MIKGDIFATKICENKPGNTFISDLEFNYKSKGASSFFEYVFVCKLMHKSKALLFQKDLKSFLK